MNHCYEESTGEGKIDGEIYGFKTSARDISNLVIRKYSNDLNKKVYNLRSNRIYHNFSYKIFNKKKNLIYKKKESFLTAEKLPSTSEKNIAKLDNETSIKIEKVTINKNNQDDLYKPLNYGEVVYLKFNDEYICANPITGYEKVYISDDNDNYLYVNKDAIKRSGNNRIRQRAGTYSKIEVPKGFGIEKNLNRNEDYGEFYFFDINHSQKNTENSDDIRNKQKEKPCTVGKNKHGYNRGVDNNHAKKIGIKEKLDKGIKFIIRDDNEKNNLEYPQMKFLFGQTGSSDYNGGFDDPIDKNDTIKFNKEYTIYSNFTRFYSTVGDGYVDIKGTKWIESGDDLKKSDKDLGNSANGWDYDCGHYYIRQLRGILSSNLSEVDHFGSKFKIHTPSGSKKNVILPSKLNKYNNGNEKMSFEKVDDNYPFKLDTDKDNQKKLQFKFIEENNLSNPDSQSNDRVLIDIGMNDSKKLYLYNKDYGFYLVLDNSEENNNSFYYSTNQNDIKDNCELNLVMAVPGEENKKRKKICFKTEPYQTVELPKLTLGPDNCEENQIKMLDQNTSLGNGNYNFCSSQEHNSQNVRNKMIPSNPIFNTPYHPLPLPHQDENEPLFAS